MPPSPTLLLCDLALSRRLERAEAASNARLVEARVRQDAESNAGWIDIDGTYAMFDGVHSPCTQTFGLGLFHPLTASGLDRIEAFFNEHGAATNHEVSPIADPSHLQLLPARGYQPIELTSVLFLELRHRILPQAPPDSAVTARLVDDRELEIWAKTAAEGWSDSAAIPDLDRLMKVAAGREQAYSLLAEIDGTPVAAGSLATHDGVALLAGASTVPQWRHRGAQRALLQARLAWAQDHGCDLAMMCAAPGSSSQRNAEREGFRIAYTRIKWSRPHSTPSAGNDAQASCPRNSST